MSENQIISDQPIQGAGSGEESCYPTEGQGRELCQSGNWGDSECPRCEDGDDSGHGFRAVREAIQKCAKDSADAFKAEPHSPMPYYVKPPEELRGNITTEGGGHIRSANTEGERMVQSHTATNQFGSIGAGQVTDSLLGESERHFQWTAGSTDRERLASLMDYATILKKAYDNERAYSANLQEKRKTEVRELLKGVDSREEVIKILRIEKGQLINEKNDLLDENIALSKRLDNIHGYLVAIAIFGALLLVSIFIKTL